MIKFRLNCFQSIEKGMNTQSETPFLFSTNEITYSTNGYYLNGFKKDTLNEWRNCEITNAEWYKKRFHIYINNNNEYSYASNNKLISIVLYFHYILKYKLKEILGVLGGLYSIIDIIISIIK